MNAMRERAKEHFPTVLLTLLSIVQALALELLWSHLHAADYLFERSWLALLSWLQIVATLLSVVLIWVVYASQVMRFRWVPATSDSVYPFLIGVIEFMLIDTLGPNEIGMWMLLVALTFAVMQWVTHHTMRRARADTDNTAFFTAVEPARLSDFYPAIGVVSLLALLGLYIHLRNDTGTVALIALLAANGILAWQFREASHFWERSVSDAVDQ